MRLRRLAALPLAFLLAGCSVKITGTYSTLEFTSGHTRGMEMFIVRGPDSMYFAMVQCANGTLGRPVLLQASVLADELSLPAIRDPRADCPAGPFTGHVGPGGIEGAFAGGPAVSLPRKDSAWK